MISAKRASHITGLEVRPVEGGGFAAYDHGFEVIRCPHPQDVVKLLYDRRRQQVFREQGFLCLRCNRFRALQCHHLHSRARGERSDERRNLCGVCAACHELLTNPKQPMVLIPHYKVLEIVRKNAGLEWDAEGQQWREHDSGPACPECGAPSLTGCACG